MRCAICPDVEARIIAAMDLDGRRAAIERVRERNGDMAADAVKHALADIWARRKENV